MLCHTEQLFIIHHNFFSTLQPGINFLPSQQVLPYTIFNVMQVCQNLCVVILEARKCVANLDLGQAQRLNTHSQSSVLLLLNTKLDTAAKQLSPAQFQPVTNDSQLIQLIKCLASLITALVAKLDPLQQASAAHVGAHNSPTNLADGHMFSQLWCLLFTTCHSFGFLPKMWPIRELADYQSLQHALHGLLLFQLQITRACSSIWLNLWERLGPNTRHKHAATMSFVSLAYLQNVCTWPASRMLEEFAALPTNFISLQCCLTLEQLERLAPDAARATRFPGTMYPIRLDVMSLPLSMLMLGEALGIFVRKTCEMSRQDVLARLASPAVIETLKHILIIHTDQQGANISSTFSTAAAANSLNRLLYAALGSNKSELPECANEAFPSLAQLKTLEHVCVHQLVQPTLDIKLLLCLLKHVPSDVEVLKSRYSLVTALLCSSRSEIFGCSSESSPPLNNYLKCVYIAAHHCYVQTSAWMKQQETTQQNLLQQADTPIPSALRPWAPNFIASLSLHKVTLDICAFLCWNVWKIQQGGCQGFSDI